MKRYSEVPPWIEHGNGGFADLLKLHGRPVHRVLSREVDSPWCVPERHAVPLFAAGVQRS